MAPTRESESHLGSCSVPFMFASFYGKPNVYTFLVNSAILWNIKIIQWQSFRKLSKKTFLSLARSVLVSSAEKWKIISHFAWQTMEQLGSAASVMLMKIKF